MSEDFAQKDLININTMNNVKPKEGPKVDKLVSEAVGKDIYVNNPTLIKKITEWKKAKGDSEEQDNFLDDPEKIKELKAIL